MRLAQRLAQRLDLVEQVEAVVARGAVRVRVAEAPLPAAQGAGADSEHLRGCVDPDPTHRKFRAGSQQVLRSSYKVLRGPRYGSCKTERTPAFGLRPDGDARGLGGVGRLGGALEQALGVEAVGRAVDDPGGDRDARPVVNLRARDQVGDAVGQRHERVGAGVRGEDRELVLLEAEHLVDLANLAAQDRSDGVQHPVAARRARRRR